MEFGGYNVESWEISEIYLRQQEGIRDIEAIYYVRFCRFLPFFQIKQ